MVRRAAIAAFVVQALVATVAPAWAAEPDVLAVVACDPYADLKKQVRWIGTLADQPALDALVETPLMMVTQFKGLAGLDTTRPAGLVVTAAGDVPAVHAYVPVKDLGRLLEALQGVTGPVEEVDGSRRVSPPGAMPLDIVEKNGWAIIGPRGVAVPPLADPAAVFDPVVRQFTLGVQAFPSRMPAAMRKQLQTMLDQAAAIAAADGRPVDPAGLAGMLDNLDQTESLTIGVALDVEGERVALESQSRMQPASPAAAALADAAKGVVTVASPATTDGKPAAVALHLAMAVPEPLRQAAVDGLDTIKAQDGSDAGTRTAVVLLKEALTAMIAAGGYDAALSMDTSAITEGDTKPVPTVTAGIKVQDGAALEARIKKLLADAGDLPGLKVAFDTGKAAGANLHTITLQNFGFPGLDKADDTLDVTLAVAPAYAYLLTGGDVPGRLAAVVAASGKPVAAGKPLADVTVALAPLLRYVASLSRPEDLNAAAEGLRAAADFADTQKSALVELAARPIEQGMAVRLSADAGAIRTVALNVKAQAAPRRPALPAPRSPRAAPSPAPSPALSP